MLLWLPESIQSRDVCNFTQIIWRIIVDDTVSCRLQLYLWYFDVPEKQLPFENASMILAINDFLIPLP